jgi:flagellar hook protein FlgE
MSIMGAAVTGMNADTTWLASISQNVANANTTGYKNEETSFEALVNQTSSASFDAAGVSTNTRSLNSMQGIVVGGQADVTDLGVQGNGFFLVSDAAGDTFLTRDGSFVPDASGNLVNSDGYYLMGYTYPAQVSANSSLNTQVINVDSAGSIQTPTTTGTFSANLPSTSTNGQTETTSLVAYDNLGGSQNLSLQWTNNSTGATPNTWGLTITDSTGATVATATATFSAANGQISGLTGAGASGNTLSFAVPNGQTMSLDLGGMTQLAGNYGVNTATVNGNAPSSVTGVTIGKDGTLSFQYANGQTVPAYQIPLATVPSPDGLAAISGNAYQVTLTSGQMQIGFGGNPGYGTIQSSSLENSTVDLASELTDMVRAQSAYQANSKSFQTGATLLDILNNLKT